MHTVQTIAALLIEERPLVAAGLISLLDDPAMWKIEWVHDRESAFSYLRRDGTTNLLIVGEPVVKDSPDTQQAVLSNHLRKNFPHIPIVALTNTVIPPNARALRRSGVFNSIYLGEKQYVIKRKLMNAAAIASPGAESPPQYEVPQDASVSGGNHAEFDITAARAVSMTHREEEVTALLSKGMTNKEIADVLYISPETIKTHVSNVLKKLGAVNRCDLIARLGALNIEINDSAGS